MEEWLGLPEEAYKGTVYRFYHDLPPEDVLDAVQIARDKIPWGGRAGFLYFCGVCHGRIKEQRIPLSWD